MNANQSGRVKMSGPHKRRIDRHEHKGILPGGFDQTRDQAEGGLKEIIPHQWNMQPILRPGNGRIGRLYLFVLDLEKIHPSLAEKFQVFVNGGLSLVVSSIEMHEKCGRYVIRGGLVMDQV
jgi:hypothetical protein